MHLPDTQNANHVHAFKKGYRLALEGKPLTNMPSAFRYDRTLREYYEQGWSQANEEFEAGHQASLEKPWRSRIAWTVVIVLGSIATAVGMINSIKQEQTEQQSRILGTDKKSAVLSSVTESAQPKIELKTLTLDTEISTSSPTDRGEPALTATSESTTTEANLKAEEISLLNSSDTEHSTLATTDAQTDKAPEQPEPTIPPNIVSPPPAELSLLTSAQREDLVLNQQEQRATPQIKPQTIIESDIKIESAHLTSNIENRQAVDELIGAVPKQVRKLHFFTEVKGAENQTLYHRWLFNNQEMALIPLPIDSNLYRTWSSKQMASAWQGPWTVELLNERKEVIYRQSFQYGNPR